MQIDEWKILDKEIIKKEVEVLESLNYTERSKAINELQLSLPKPYQALQQDISTAYRHVIDTLKENQILTKYNIDLYFGIEFYNILESYGFNARNASIDKVWYYISLYVMPDIIFSRFSSEKEQLSFKERFLRRAKKQTATSEKEPKSLKDHFWKKSRRIYPKTLWWYIYLSLPKNILDKDEQYSYLVKTLKYNTTDTILQIVERTSTYGYRRDLYSEIIKAYSVSKRDPNTLRKVLVMNTTKTKVIEPALTAGGIKQYVKRLFLSVGEELTNYDIT